MRTARITIAILGVAALVWGSRLLLEQGGKNLGATMTWLIAGVVLHDGILAPTTIALAVLGGLLIRRPIPPPVVVGAVALGTVTLVAVPVLGRFGVRPDNPTLLDRDYAVGWFAFAGSVLLIVLVAVGLGMRRQKDPGDDVETRPPRST